MGIGTSLICTTQKVILWEYLSMCRFFSSWSAYSFTALMDTLQWIRYKGRKTILHLTLWWLKVQKGFCHAPPHTTGGGVTEPFFELFRFTSPKLLLEAPSKNATVMFESSFLLPWHRRRVQLPYLLSNEMAREHLRTGQALPIAYGCKSVTHPGVSLFPAECISLERYG